MYEVQESLNFDLTYFRMMWGVNCPLLWHVHVIHVILLCPTFMLNYQSRDPVLDTDGPLELDDLSRIGSLDTWQHKLTSFEPETLWYISCYHIGSTLSYLIDSLQQIFRRWRTCCLFLEERTRQEKHSLPRTDIDWVYHSFITSCITRTGYASRDRDVT